MKSPPKRYEIYFADLSPTLGSEISKIRLKNKIDILPEEQAAQLRRIITEMYGE